MKANPNFSEFTRQLREQAMADSPQFSPLLHARIMQQINAMPHPSIMPERLHPWRSMRNIWYASAAAAILTLATTLWLHQQDHRQPVARTLQSKPAVPGLTVRFPTLSEPADSPLTQARYGYLDRDANSVAHYVMDQFDVLPTSPPPPPGRRG